MPLHKLNTIMRYLLTVRAASLFLVFALFTGCASNDMQPIQRLSADGYHIDILASGGTLHKGANTLVLEVTRNGEPVVATEAHATFSMPAMGTMPYMETPAHFETDGPRLLQSSVQFSMAGGWNVQLEVQTPQGPLSGSFKVQVVE